MQRGSVWRGQPLATGLCSSRGCGYFWVSEVLTVAKYQLQHILLLNLGPHLMYGMTTIVQQLPKSLFYLDIDRYLHFSSEILQSKVVK